MRFGTHGIALALLTVLSLGLTGCPAFYVDRGSLVTPSAALDRPAPDKLPASSTYVELSEKWRRDVRIGLGGYAQATLYDPKLAAAQIAHEAAVQSMRPNDLQGLITNRWATYYGDERDRFPIDILWHFEEQFISKSTILDPTAWTISLVTSTGLTVAPLSVSTLRAEKAPRAGLWEGAVRLWFPWRDAVSQQVLLGGQTDWVALKLSHPSGSGELTWRFRSIF
jgi:hypothetical protein